MLLITPRHAMATLVRHRNNGILYYSHGLWHSPADALEERPEEFRQLDYKLARHLFGDAVPQWPGEWAAVESMPISACDRA